MSAPTSAVPADTNHQPWAHPRFVQQTKLAEQGGFDLMLLGDSITQGWEMWGKNAWIQKMAPKFTAGNFGIGADRTENVLWRLESGHLKGAINPKVVMLMIGTNNTDANEPQDIALGVQAIVNKLTARFPKAHVLLLGVFPRRDRNNAVVAEINRVLPRLDDGKQVHFMDIGDAFLKNGQPDPALYADHVHLNNAGYEKWADKVVPVIAQWMK